MISRLWRLLVGLLGEAPTLLVLAALGGLGWWGAKNDWKIGSLASLWAGEKKDADKPEKKDGDPKEGEKSDSEGKTSDATPTPPIILASDEAAEKAGFEEAPVVLRAVEEHVRASAVLAFNQDRYAHLSTRAPGAAWKVYKQVGQSVEKGEVLALVSAAEVGKVRADLLHALVQVDLKEKILRRLEFAADTVPERQVIEARGLLREARVRLLADQQALANFDLPLRRQDLSGLTDDQIARHIRLLGLPAELAGDDPDRLPANLLPLRAPFKGLVIRRDMVAGEMVTTTTPQFVLADVRRLWVMLDVRLEDVRRLELLGQPIAFHSDATGQTALGKLAWISADVDPKTRTVRARAEVDNPDERLRPATFGTVKVCVSSREALLLPDAAVQWDGKGQRAFVRLDRKTFQPHLVVPGARVDGHTEAIDPALLLAAGTGGLLAPCPGGALPGNCALLALAHLRAGDKVVTTGSHVLKSEMQKDRIGGGDD